MPRPNLPAPGFLLTRGTGLHICKCYPGTGTPEVVAFIACNWTYRRCCPILLHRGERRIWRSKCGTSTKDPWDRHHRPYSKGVEGRSAAGCGTNLCAGMADQLSGSEISLAALYVRTNCAPPFQWDLQLVFDA